MAVKDLLVIIAGASHMRIRQVALKGEWYKRDNGPLLAYMEEDNHPFISLLLAAFAIAFAANMPMKAIVPTITGGFGNLLGNIGIVLFLGTPVNALFVGFFFSLLLLPEFNEKTLSGWVNEAIKSASNILLVRGAGGALGAILKAVNYPIYREGGRLENYLGNPALSQGACKILYHLVKCAAANLELVYRKYLDLIDWITVVFAGMLRNIPKEIFNYDVRIALQVHVEGSIGITSTHPQ